ncbi:oxidoreductase [Jannaschia sp. EhC01]|nr:oxidoreductase [Jannaschia sp. EhC01]
MTQSIYLAISGLGLIGRRHAQAIARQPGIELVGVADPAEAGQVEAHRLGVPCYDSLPEMIEATRPEGVIIATPTSQHAAQALTCIDRALPVLIEKPIATSVAEGQRVVDAAEARGVPVLVGHHRRYNPLIEKAHEVITSGILGEVRAVQATCWFYKPDAYFEEAPWRKQKGAGPISVNLVHDVDLLRHLCGEVISVRAMAAPSRRGSENEDVAAALLTFESGALGTLTVSDAIAAPWSWEMTARENAVYPATAESCYLIGGSRGALSLPDLRVWSHTGKAPDWWLPISATHLAQEAADPLVRQIAHFGAVIRDGVAPRVSAREGMRTLVVIEAIQRSAETGDAVQLSTGAA